MFVDAYRTGSLLLVEAVMITASTPRPRELSALLGRSSLNVCELRINNCLRRARGHGTWATSVMPVCTGGSAVH